MQLLKVDGKDFEGALATYKSLQRERNIATATGFGVQNPAAIIDDYEKTIEKWRPLSKEIGRDIDKFADALKREVFSKIDLSKL